MQKKYLLLLIGIIGGAAAIGTIYGIQIITDNQSGNKLATYMLTIAFTPVPVRIEVSCDTSWEGNWTIGTKSNVTSGVGGIYNFTGKISGIENAVGHFYISNMLGSHSINVTIYLNGKLMDNKTALVVYTVVSVNQKSPYSDLIPLAFLTVAADLDF